MLKTKESSDRNHRRCSKHSTKDGANVEKAVAMTDSELFVVDTSPATPQCSVDNDDDAADATKEQPVIAAGLADEGGDGGGGNDDNVGGEDMDRSKKRKRKRTRKV
jgi:hypothetical protein